MKLIINSIKRSILLLFVAMANLTPAYSQGDSKGTDFWLMFNGNNATPVLTLFITSSVNTSGFVSGPSFAPIPFNVVANTVTAVNVPSTLAIHTNNVVDNKGIHVTALQEVTVYGLNYVAFTTDAYLGLPTDVLGTDYVVLTYKNSGFNWNASQLGIVGTVNGTTVTITPSVTTAGRVAGVPYNIVLNQGDVYELENNSGTNDLTGTIISATQPVGVLGSNRCANIPQGFSFCDHTTEMLPPTNTWGKQFVTVPLASRANGDTWRFLASENGTTVTINGAAQPPINAGQYIETILTTRSIISSDKPILVAQYSNGSDFSGNPGDPFMMIITPYEQFLGNYTLTTVAGYVAHFINVVAPNSIVGSVTLDGVPIPAGLFIPIGASGFSGAQVSVPPGSHTLNGPLPFGAFQYGFNNDDSYGYPGGQAFGQIAVVSTVNMTPANGSGTVNTQQCFDVLVLDQNNNPLQGVRVDFTVSGANPSASFVFTGANGVAQFCYTGTNAGNDVITASIGTLTDVSNFVWSSACANNNPPTFVSTITNPMPACGSTLQALVGATTSFTVYAGDTDPNSTIGMTIANAPAGAVVSLPSGGNPTSSSFQWTPTAAEIGLYTITYTAIDNCQATAVCNISINVSTAPTDPYAGFRCGKNNSKVMVAHFPPGNTANCQSLCISEMDVPSHLAHGDVLGACPAAKAGAPAYAGIHVSPNPSTGIFTVTLGQTEKATVIVQDMLGRSVWNKSLNNASDVQIDLSKHPKGVYFVDVNNGLETHRSKVIVK